MLQSKPMSGDERRLAKLFRALGADDKRTLLAFAEFLAQGGQHRDGQPKDAAQVPQLQPRPMRETVIAAIRRLSAGYPMLDRGAMLNETSALMSDHVMQGRAAAEVIDDLQALFEREYARYQQRNEPAGEPAGEPAQAGLPPGEDDRA